MKGIGYYGRDFFVVKSDYDLVAESITRILMTNPNERPGQPYFGVGLKNQIFELLDETVISSIDAAIREQIGAYEPRATINSLLMTPDSNENTLSVKLGFTLMGDKIGDQRFINVVYQLGK
jgi:phage baseplate assembly protein W